MTLALWPEQDRRIWQNALRAGEDLLDEQGARAGLSPISNRKVEKGYGRWLTWLTLSEGACSAHPADRITPHRMQAFVQHLIDLGNSTQTLMSRLAEIGSMAAVLDPSRDWSFIARMAARIRARHRPARQKHDALVLTDDLLDLGLDLIGKAEQQTTARRRATTYRDGLIIALLALRPLRRRNLAQLDLGRTLVRRAGTWRIEIPAEDTKTHAPIEEGWPMVLIEPLERYLAQHRPLLGKAQGRWSGPVGDALWVSSDGSPMTEMALYDRVRERTREAFGTSVNPHLFRDAAATTLAIEAPADVHLAAPLLGHRSLAVTERHYQQAKSLEAHRSYAGVLATRRDR